MFREPEETKLFDTDCLAAAPTDDDEVKMVVPKVYGAKDTSGPLSSANHPILVAAQKPLSSDMDSIFVFVKQNTLICIIKCLLTNAIKGTSTIWRWDQVQGCNFIFIS